MPEPISALRNLGPKSEALLAEIGVNSVDDLRALGAVEAYAMLCFRFGKAISRNMLHAIAGALADRDWRQLTLEHKAELERMVEARLRRFESGPAVQD
ncbi:TfoX/Sxy family DNA transformation protein [Rhizobium sp. KVB221]|uniref:TfoX/Sxy family DNA transformation protein n=1 Tax=Rhizobium setariae TaxID=2801340 RepID=A0A937CN26_9HYPH|nr:TfoX/Sxy family DNA transformation protein [Rhizobium setariae]MBL0371574.1 TfoX/Sxy family DNA transformation protein [Rhizobium setariae]